MISYPGGVAIADGTGLYAFPVGYGWSGSVTPATPGFTFSPDHTDYSDVTSDQVQNYTATAITYTISGNAGLDGVTLSYTNGTPKTVTSASDGTYSLTVPYKWSGTVIPAKIHYTFTPVNIGYSLLTSNQPNQNFTPAVIPPTFTDVPYTYSVTYGGIVYPLYPYIQALYDAGYTAGCWTSPMRYCPGNTLTRAESAVFVLRGYFGSGYLPPAGPWTTFTVDDWSRGSWAEAWAEGMWAASLTAGCWSDPLKFCPWDMFPRDQAAVFGLRLKYGPDYIPPDAMGDVFGDLTDLNYWGTKWAEQAYADDLLPRCGTSGSRPLFCPNDLITRAWAAYMIVKAKNLPLLP